MFGLRVCEMLGRVIIGHLEVFGEEVEVGGKKAPRLELIDG